MATNKQKRQQHTTATVEYSFNLHDTSTATLASAPPPSSNNTTVAAAATPSPASTAAISFSDDDKDDHSDDLGHAAHTEAAAAALLAREELVEAVDFFVQWKDALIQVHPLPNSALLPLLTTSSKLLRCRDVLKNNIQTLANLAQSFAKGLLSNDHINRLKTAKEEVTLQLSMEKLRAMERDRKLTSALGLLRQYRDEIRYVRWYRLIFKLRQKEQMKHNNLKVQTAQTTIANLKTTTNHLKKKCAESEQLQKATSSVAVKNQTKGDVLEKQMKQGIKREKKLTSMVANLTNDNAKLSKLVDAMEKKEIERKAKEKRMRNMNKKDNQDDARGRIKKNALVVGSQDGEEEWKEERKKLIAKDIERNKKEREGQLDPKQQQQTLQEQKQQQLSAGTPLWVPGQQQQQVQQAQQPQQNETVSTPVARAARASSKRRKAQADKDSDSDDGKDPWSVEAMTPPPTPYMKHSGQEQDNFTTVVATAAALPIPPPFTANRNATVEEQRVEEKKEDPGKEAEKVRGVQVKATEEKREMEEKRDQDSRVVAQATPVPTTTPPQPTAPQPKVPQLQPTQSLQQTKPPAPTLASATTTSVANKKKGKKKKKSSSTTSSTTPIPNELVPVELLVTVKQNHASEMMRMKQHHDEHLNSLKLKLAEAESIIIAKKKEIKLLNRQHKKRGGGSSSSSSSSNNRTKTKYNGTPSYSTNDNSKRRDFFAEASAQNSTATTSTTNNNATTTTTNGNTTDAWDTVPAGINRRNMSKKAARQQGEVMFTLDDPNVEDLLRYQKLATESFQQNHPNDHQDQRPKTTPVLQTSVGSGSARGRSGSRLVSRNTSSTTNNYNNNTPYYNNNNNINNNHNHATTSVAYHMAPDRIATDYALKEALKENGPLRLPANFMPSTAVRGSTRNEGYQHHPQPRPPTTGYQNNRSSKKNVTMKQINFSSRIYTKKS